MAELLKESDLSPGKSSDAGDQEFEPSADMLVHDYDDEQTLAEEEALAIAGGEDPQSELNSLQKESDMPLEELLAMYGYNGQQGSGDGREAGGGAEERMDEDMEEDDEEEEEDEEEEDESVESTSSSSAALVPDKKSQNVRPGSKTEPNETEPVAAPSKVKSEVSHTKNRSDLHLLYSQSEEGSVTGARLLRSAGAAGTNADDEEGDEEEDDVDYAPGEDEWRKTIMIGSDYQAYVPSGLSPYENSQTLPYENEDKLLWTPSQVASSMTEEYLQKCAHIHQQLMQSRIAAATTSQPLQTLALLASLPLGAHTRDDEQALHLLLQCGYNVEEALRRRKMSTITPCDTASLWSEEECRNFESGLRIFGKDFHHIQQQKVRTRSVGELVQFYYLWKKTERHDVLANRARLEKKKYALHPGTTDYMDRFLDEQEQPTAAAGMVAGAFGVGHGGTSQTGRDRSHSRSSSPNVYSLIYGDPKRLRVSATPPAATSEDGGASTVVLASNGVSLVASGVDGAAGIHPIPAHSAPSSGECEAGNGQVLSAAAAAAAAAATVVLPPSSSSSKSSSSTSSSSSSASSPSAAAATAAVAGETKASQRNEQSS